MVSVGVESLFVAPDSATGRFVSAIPGAAPDRSAFAADSLGAEPDCVAAFLATGFVAQGLALAGCELRSAIANGSCWLELRQLHAIVARSDLHSESAIPRLQPAPVGLAAI